ncbi:MAG: NADH pyrophosphatase, partial [Pseudomonadales bacterium]|nr:NADH pyrophosphatase [Pseudomonadales bacterium]
MTIKYTQMPLDRCANQRCDSLWLQLQFDHEQAAFTVLDKGLHLFNNDSSMVYLSRAQLAVEKRLTLDKAVFLGLDTQRPVFAIDMQLLEDTVQQQLRRQYQWHNLLAVTARIDHGDAAVLGFARAIIHWHGTHGFCGRCGSKNTLVEAGHSRLCTLESCGHQTFPRTDP